MGKKDLKKRNKSKRNYPRILLFLIIFAGLILSAAGFYFISSQRKVREHEYRRELNRRLNTVVRDIENRLEREIRSVFQQLESKESDNTELFENRFKKEIDQIDFARHPFILNSNGSVIYPEQDLMILPLSEKPDEYHLYRKLTQFEVPDPDIEDIRINRKIFLGSEVDNIYREALILEFRKGDIEAALTMYKKAVLKNRHRRFNTIFYNSIGRCRARLGKYNKAAAMYLMLLKKYGHFLKRDLFYLKVRVLRELAVLALRSGSEKKAVEFYDTIIETTDGKKPQKYSAFSLFRYEAEKMLEELSYKRVESRGAGGNSRNAKASLFSRLESYKGSGKVAPLDKTYTDKTDAFYYKYMRDLYFYSRIVSLRDWRSKSGNDTYIESVNPVNIKKKYSLCYRRYTVKGVVRIVGFSFDQFRYSRRKFREIVNREFELLKLRGGFINDSPDKKYRYPVLSVMFNRFFHWNSIVLYSDDKDHIGSRVNREIGLTYSLMGTLILIFILFTFLYYKYITREAELLRLKSDFVDSVSHTLKTPLTRISLMAENIAGNWVQDENKRREFLETIVSESVRMNDLIDNMLSFSRIDAGKKVYDLRNDSISYLVQEIVDNYSDYISKRGFNFKVDIEEGLPAIYIDREAVKLIVINLLQNSIKYSLEEKYISLQLYSSGRHIILRVADKGMGISSDDCKKIFDKYYRVQNKRVRSLEGSGLGLFLVYDAVKAHRGDVKVESKPGEGTAFTVKLPVDGEESE